VATLRFAEQVAYIREKSATAVRKIALARGWSAAELSAPDMIDESAEILMINHEAWLRYEPRTYPGRLVLIRAELTPNWVGTRFDDPLLGWGGLAVQGVEAHGVPADHWAMLHRQNVPPLAGVLNEYLRG
jgi:hypothetical protein